MLHYKTNYSVFDLINFFDFADFDLFVFVLVCVCLCDFFLIVLELLPSCFNPKIMIDDERASSKG